MTYINCEDCEWWRKLLSEKVGHCDLRCMYTDATYGCDPEEEEKGKNDD